MTPEESQRQQKRKPVPQYHRACRDPAKWTLYKLDLLVLVLSQILGMAGCDHQRNARVAFPDLLGMLLYLIRLYLRGRVLCKQCERGKVALVYWVTFESLPVLRVGNALVGLDSLLKCGTAVELRFSLHSLQGALLEETIVGFDWIYF